MFPLVKRLVVAALFAILASPVVAMTLEVRANVLFATGPVVDDVRQFEMALSNGQVNTVAFVNSPGGDLWAALRVAGLIAAKGVNTVVAGYCASACSIMFMGGKERRFSDAFRPNLTYVGIHGAHNPDTKQVSPTAQPQIYAFFKLTMGDKFNSNVMNQSLYEMDDRSGLLRVFDQVRNSKTPPYFCKSDQVLRDKCTTFPDTDALRLGVVTHTDLVKLELPDSFRLRVQIMGKEPVMPMPDMPGYLSSLAEKQCTSVACKTITLSLNARMENRAIAVPQSGAGRGAAWNADSPTQAIVRAVYACNHMPAQPVRLCEVELVNEFDVRPLVKEAIAEHAQALGSLVPPQQKFYANEEFGGGFTRAEGFRTSKWSDITPSQLEGVRMVGTQVLASMLLAVKPPALIEVSGAFTKVIPTSEVMINSGFASDDAAKDLVFAKRFEALLKVVAPDKAAPIVFYCASRSCWLSVNAAMRARAIGYTQVHWYRGGMESWVEAQLPTATAVVRAVAN